MKIKNHGFIPIKSKYLFPTGSTENLCGGCVGGGDDGGVAGGSGGGDL